MTLDIELFPGIVVLPDQDSVDVGPHLELVTEDYVAQEPTKTYEEVIFDEGVRAGRDFAANESAEQAARGEVILVKGRLADVEERLKQLKIEELYWLGRSKIATKALADCGIAKSAKKKP